MCLLVCFALHVAFIVDKVMIVDDHGRQVLCQLVLKISVVRVASDLLSEGITSDVYHVDGSGQRQVPKTFLTVNHIEGNIKLL